MGDSHTTHPDEPREPPAPSRPSDALLAAALGCLGEAVLAVDPAACVTFLNPAAEALTGWSAANAVGSPLGAVLGLGGDPAPGTLRNALQTCLAERRTVPLAGDAVLTGQPGGARRLEGTAALLAGESGAAAGAVLVVRDVTARLRAESLAAAAARKYAAMFEVATDGAWVHGLDGIILEANEAYCRMSGYSREELAGMHISDVEANEKAPDVAAHIRHLLQCGGRDRFESRHRRKDGSIYDVDITAFYLDIGDGMIATFSRDIGERKRADVAVRESEEKFAAVFHSSPVPMTVAGLPGGILTDVNQAWLDLAGCACKEDVLGRTTVDLGLVPDPESRHRLLAEFERTGIIRNAELKVRTRDGVMRDLFISVDTIDFGGRSLALTTNIDVTERNRAAEALRKSEEEYRHLVEHAPTGIYEIDYAGPRFRRVNDAMCAILGYTREELLAMSPFDLLDAESGDRFRERVARVTAGEPVDEAVAYRVLRKDGSEIWGALNVKPLFTDGKPDGALVVAHDITQRKRAEEAVRELNDRLRRAMRETHHRVKNNLQVIAALIDMLEMSDRETVPVDEVVRLGRHVRGLAAIHDVLTREAGVNGDVEALSVPAALEKLKPLLAETCGGRALGFEVEEAALPVRQGTALVVAVNELVSNALKHGQGAIDVRFTVSGGFAELQVCDHGPGFPAGFDPEAGARTGLDLVRSVSRWDLQGVVAFANAPEGGACVTVRFPMAAGHRDVG